jgi:hypothetical protein
MPSELIIRLAKPAEKKTLEDLQRRASLIWEEPRKALLAHPDAIDLPVEHIESGELNAKGPKFLQGEK